MEMSQLKTYTLAVVTVLEIEEKLGTEPWKHYKGMNIIN
jgi:hypothetical protein